MEVQKFTAILFLIKMQLKAGPHFVSLNVINSNGIEKEP